MKQKGEMYMNNKNRRCCFSGHNQHYNDMSTTMLEAAIENLILYHNVNEFWVGHYGAFDAIAAKAVRNVKQKHPKVELDLILPYLTKEINDNKDFYYENYDHILISNISFSTPKSLYIIKTNEYIVDHSGFLICHIDHTWGGAFKTYQYAKRKKLEILNIADLSNNGRV